MYVFRQADLDTCLAAAILGASDSDEAVHRPEGATSSELADPSVMVIEAGGSGETWRGNFDHHEAGGPSASACLQAFEFAGQPEPYRRLAMFGHRVDTSRVPFALPYPGPTHLISGIRILHRVDPKRQFLEGVRAMRLIANLGLDPWRPLPRMDEWREALRAKECERTRLAEVESDVRLRTVGDWSIGFLTSTVVGSVGLLYRRGADIAVVHNPAYHCSNGAKYTIGGNQLRVDGLLGSLNAIEPGWGGPSHGSIIGSPFAGSRLSPIQVSEIVEREVGGWTR